jgi:trans-2,3-dihydro-3-hydroxyanthranilate isomerase
MGFDYVHVDVFASAPFRGNSLAVFPDARGLNAAQRLIVTQELRHYESIFLEPLSAKNHVRAHIFDLFEELDFAGHPVLGAAVVLHRRSGQVGPQEWTFVLNHKQVIVRTERRGMGWWATMQQGQPEFFGVTPAERWTEFLEALNCRPDMLDPDLPLEVVSLGLPYLIVPLRDGLETARIVHRDFATLIGTVGAQFAYLVDVDHLEGRTWNNDGVLEDVATGSAAGVVGAYLLKYGRIRSGQTWTLQQGRFAGRPSELSVQIEGSAEEITAVTVGGSVFVIGQGTLEVQP